MWIEYHTALRDHWKIKRLADALEVDYITALGAISCLWLWCAEYAPSGYIGRFTDDEIRFASRISLKKFSLVTLMDAGLVNNKKTINDWGKYGLKLLVSKRKANREYAKRKRNSGYPRDIQSVAIPTIPNHTIPNHTNNTIVQDFFAYFTLKTNKNFKLTGANRDLIAKRLKEGYTLEQLKKAVDNFVQDDWPERYKHLDLIYCLGKQRGKPDALEKWLNFKPKQEVRYG